MERYHDLIVSLIKANRKYPECKDIMEDIVADVYEHAQVVLNTVSNESVISSYLNKIVTTSVITVSRRLGTHSSRTENIDISSILNSKPEITPELSTPEGQEQQVEEETSDEAMFEEISDDYEAVTEPEDTDLTADVTEEEEFETEEEPLVSDVDKSLVDKMINGISAEEQQSEDILYLEETEIPDMTSSEDEGFMVEEDAIESIDEEMPMAENEEEAELLQGDFEIEEYSELEKEMAEIEEAEPENEIISAEEEEEELVNPEEVSEISDFVPEEAEGLETAEIPEEMVEAEMPEAEEMLETPEEMVEAEIPEAEEMLEEPEDLEAFEILGEQDESAELEEANEIEEEVTEEDGYDENNIGSPSYECFNYSPQPVEIDSDEIKQQIDDLKNEYSDIDISEIYKLKYQEKLSVDEIASKLDMSDEKVLDILKEFVYIVKD